MNQRLPRVADFIHGQQRGQSLRQGFLRIMDHLLVLFSDLIQILDKIHVTNKPEKSVFGMENNNTLIIHNKK